MSRGLGRRQRLLLQAMRALEIERGDGGPFYVWSILEVAWKGGLELETVSRDKARAEHAVARRARTEAAAAAGDVQAAADLRNMKLLGYGRGYSPPRKNPRHYRPRADGINPGRVFALLEARGLVERGNEHGNAAGPGAWVKLTDAGRVAGG